MRKELLRLLRCPSCRRDGSITPQRMHIREDELWEGSLRCSACDASYPLSEGIPDLIADPSLTVLNEREAYAKSKEEVTERIQALVPATKEIELRKIALMEHTGEQFQLTSELNLEGILPYVRPMPGMWLLELGAGSGWLTSRWAALGLSCVATDISKDLKLELSPLIMKQRGVYFDRVLADMTDLPFAAGFDLVFVSASIHHAENLGASLCEAARVLKPGGRLVVINEPMHGLLRRSGKRFIDQAAEDNPGINEQSFNYFQWRRALRSASLSPVFLFPPYYAAMLQEQTGRPVSSSRLTKLARLIWRSPFKRLVYTPAGTAIIQLLLGMNVCLIAEKRTGIQ